MSLKKEYPYLSGQNSEMKVMVESRLLSIGELEKMSGNELVSSCQVYLLDSLVSLSKQDLGIAQSIGFDRPILIGKYGLICMWKGTGSCLSQNSKSLDEMSALDCLSEVNSLSQAYDRVSKSWVC